MMALRKISFAEGEYYHIYSRGNSKQKIFHDAADYQRFMMLLYACNQENAFKINNLPKGKNIYDIQMGKRITSLGTYCLMPNHFHLLVKETMSDGITIFMRKVMTAYVMYYNKKYKRTGKLFEGPFIAEHITEDRYLKYLFAYIHLNPIKLIDTQWKENGLKDVCSAKRFLSSYKYSSFLTYIEIQRPENKIITLSDFPPYFSKIGDMWKEINSWLNYKIS